MYRSLNTESDGETFEEIYFLDRHIALIGNLHAAKTPNQISSITIMEINVPPFRFLHIHSLHYIYT